MADLDTIPVNKDAIPIYQKLLIDIKMKPEEY